MWQYVGLKFCQLKSAKVSEIVALYQCASTAAHADLAYTAADVNKVDNIVFL